MFRFPPLLAILFTSPVVAAPPNVLLVITDDQGYGDLGVHGNPQIRTPNLDALAKQSAHLRNFRVCPVCAPTRASLLTGQYHYRTGVTDTYLGRALMRPDVKMLPEMLAAAGYRTGLFGKWHLGDNHPLRPEDRGFQETLWSRGGGLAQPSDHPDMVWKTAYFDPILNRNGKEVKTKGYCTDVFTDAAVEFMQAKSEKPWFAYVAYNAPHGPLQVDEKLVEPFKKLDLGPSGFPKIGQPWAGAKVDTNATARLYAMIENIDSNFARLLKATTDNTLVIFLTDNGPDSARFNAGLRGRKGTVYEGGIRVPCYLQWKSAVKPPRGEIAAPLAHIDIMPSILLAAGIEAPDGLDGRAFSGPFLGEVSREKERTLFTQWHRGDVPEKFRSFAAITDTFKLVQAGGGLWDNAKWKPKFELFDLSKDPYEEHDLADEKPDVVAKLKKEYEAWFDYVTEKGFDPPRISVGSDKENPVRLSRQDWRGPKAGWNKDSLGHWEVDVLRAGKYKLTIRCEQQFAEGRGSVCGADVALKLDAGKKAETLIELKAGAGRIELEIADADGKNRRGPHYVELEFLGK